MQVLLEEVLSREDATWKDWARVGDSSQWDPSPGVALATILGSRNELKVGGAEGEVEGRPSGEVQLKAGMGLEVVRRLCESSGEMKLGWEMEPMVQNISVCKRLSHEASGTQASLLISHYGSQDGVL